MCCHGVGSNCRWHWQRQFRRWRYDRVSFSWTRTALEGIEYYPSLGQVCEATPDNFLNVLHFVKYGLHDHLMLIKLCNVWTRDQTETVPKAAEILQLEERIQVAAADTEVFRTASACVDELATGCDSLNTGIQHVKAKRNAWMTISVSRSCMLQHAWKSSLLLSQPCGCWRITLQLVRLVPILWKPGAKRHWKGYWRLDC